MVQGEPAADPDGARITFEFDGREYDGTFGEDAMATIAEVPATADGQKVSYQLVAAGYEVDGTNRLTLDGSGTVPICVRTKHEPTPPPPEWLTCEIHAMNYRCRRMNDGVVATCEDYRTLNADIATWDRCDDTIPQPRRASCFRESFGNMTVEQAENYGDRLQEKWDTRCSAD